MLLVAHLAGDRVAEGGAENADGVGAMALDFEMDGVAGQDGYRCRSLVNESKVKDF